MRRVLTGLLVVLTMAWITSCRRHDYHRVTIRVPEMKNQACAEIVSKAAHGEVYRCQALHPEETTQVDLGARTITITYDSLKLALKNIEYAIANAGFSAGELPANKEAAAKLPAECGSDTPITVGDGGATSLAPVSTNERPR